MSTTDLDRLQNHLDALLVDGVRSDLVERLSAGADANRSLARLRKAMVEHEFGADPRDLAKVIRKLDNRTRQDGFRVLHAWNHQSHTFSKDVVPALLLDFFLRAEVPDPDQKTTLAILTDYYLLHLLALCAMRVWDHADPDEALARVDGHLALLQGSGGSGHVFVDDAETLMIYALSQFHPEEQAYDRVIDRFSSMPLARRVRFANVSAAVLSAHLRWGFWLMYGRDVVRMRDDNVGDYPWLLWCTETLLDEFVAGGDRREEALVGLGQALAADPWLYQGSPPPALESIADRHAAVSALLREHAEGIASALEPTKPAKDRYSPWSLHFNFPHNVLVAITTLALLESRPRTLAINALFAEHIDGLPEGEDQEALARLLMAFSAGSPDRLGRHGAMLVAYDPLSAMRSFSMTRDELLRLAPTG